MRAALWHLALDALGSLAVVVAAVGALVFGVAIASIRSRRS